MKKITLLTISVLALGAVGPSLGSNLAHADVISTQTALKQSDVVTGNTQVNLNSAQALTKSGSRAPEYDIEAKQQLSTSPTHYLDKTISVNYSINTVTGIQSATATLLSPDDSGNSITVTLTPMGIAGEYSFIGYTDSNDQIVFSMDSNFKNPSVNVLVRNTDGAFNSLATS